MKNLNLPAFNAKIESFDGKVKIFDPLRKKYVTLTPEEWVRQHFINYLLKYHHYPKALIRVEKGLDYNFLNKRSDIIVYNRRGDVFLIVECKAPEKKIDQKSLEQVSLYGKSLRPAYIGLTNGMNHYFWKLDYSRGLAMPLDNVPAISNDT